MDENVGLLLIVKCTYKLQTAIQHASDIIQKSHSGSWWDQQEKMFGKSDSILLLLSWSVDVSKEKGDVMPANKGHYCCVIMPLHASFDTCAPCCFVGFLTNVNGFIRYLWWVGFGLPFVHSLNLSTNFINLLFQQEVNWLVELGAVTTDNQVPVAKVSISGNNNIWPPFGKVSAVLCYGNMSTYFSMG